MDIPFDLLKLVAPYLVKPRMKLLDWIPIDKLDWYCLSGNPNAIHLMEQNPDKIDWIYLSQNPNAIHLLEANPKKINRDSFEKNPGIFETDKKQYKIDITVKANIIDMLLYKN